MRLCSSWLYVKINGPIVELHFVVDCILYLYYADGRCRKIPQAEGSAFNMISIREMFCGWLRWSMGGEPMP